MENNAVPQSHPTPTLNKGRGERIFNVSNFPQMYQAAYGFAKGGTATDQADKSKMFQPESMTLTRISTGVHDLKHNLGNTRVIVNVSPMSLGTQFRYANIDNNTTRITVFSAAGSVADSPYAFILYNVV